MVEFRAKSARLSADAKSTLDAIAATAKDKPNASVRLRTPSPGKGKARAKKATLSANRAETVKGYLAERGVDPGRITSLGADAAGMPPLEAVEAVEVVSCAVPMAAEVQPPPPPEPSAIVVAPVPVPVPVEQEVVPGVPPVPEQMPQTPMPQDGGPLSRFGIGATLGGGATGFVDDEARAFTDTGGSWEARMSVGTRTFVGFEAAYIGSAQGITALGLDTNAVLISNGAEGDARINFTRGRIQPYVFGGLGWQHYNISNTDVNTSALLDSDDVMIVPFGVGLSFRFREHLLLDIRGTGRAAFFDDLLEGPYAATGQDAALDSWNAGLRLGWEF